MGANTISIGTHYFYDKSLNDPQNLLLDHVCGLKSFRTFSNIEFDVVAFGQRLEAFALDSRVVDEYIITTVMLDKAKALGVVKPLYFACCQLFSPPLNLEIPKLNSLKENRQGSKNSDPCRDVFSSIAQETHLNFADFYPDIQRSATLVK